MVGCPRAQHVQNAAETEEIGAMIDVAAGDLFGSHVRRCAIDDARLRQARIIHGAGKTEIRDLDARHAVLKQDVSWLDVAVDQSLLVRGGQAGRRLLADAKDLVQGEWAIARDFLLQ